MFTPQEVSNKTFPKSGSLKSGYDLAAVDEFLDTLTEDYTSLYKENATLKAKLKVLAEKIEEYRATEDAMRSTLLTAQRMASKLVQEAQSEKDRIIAEAQANSAEEIARIQEQTSIAEKRMEEAEKSMRQYVLQSYELCKQQMEYMSSIPEMAFRDEITAEAKQVQAAQSIEEEVLKAYEMEEEETVVEEAPAEEAVEPAVESDADAIIDETLSFKDDFKLDDLKFGRNYN